MQSKNYLFIKLMYLYYWTFMDGFWIVLFLYVFRLVLNNKRRQNKIQLLYRKCILKEIYLPKFELHCTTTVLAIFSKTIDPAFVSMLTHVSIKKMSTLRPLKK